MREFFKFLTFIGCLLPSICQGQDPGSIDLDLDYVMWWTNGTRLPALVSTSPAGTPQDQAGVLPNSSVLFGNDRYNDSLRNGGRFTLTRWLDTEKDIALELSYFGGGSANDLDYQLSSTGAPILARPFFNTATGQEDAQLLAYIDPSSSPIVAGGVSITGESEFHSASVLARVNYQKTQNGRIDWLLGYRFFRFREGLSISENIESTNPLGLIAPGTSLSLFDSFGASSSFHGGEVGLGWSGSVNDWLSLQGTSKIALGGVNKRLRVGGNTRVSVPAGGTAISAGGLLALPSNIGENEESDFAFLPELGIKARFLLTSNFEFNVGYSALCLTNVARVGAAVDRNIDATQLTTLDTTGAPSTGQPLSTISDSGLFVHGINLGVTLSR